MNLDYDHAAAVRRITWALITLAVGLYGLVGGLLATDTPVPGELWQAAAGAAGGLATLLVSTKTGQVPDPVPPPVQDVQVVNTTADPVPTNDTPT